MSIKGSIKSALAGVAMLTMVGGTDVQAQSMTDAEKATSAKIMRQLDSLEKDHFYLENGYHNEVKKNVKVNFASHFPSGKPITQSVYEAGARVAKKPTAPVVALIVRDADESLAVRSGNRFSNTGYEQQVLDMLTNVSNSLADPQAKVLMALAVEQEDNIKSNPNDVILYVNDRVYGFDRDSDKYKDMNDDQFVGRLAAHVHYFLSTGNYKLSNDELDDKLRRQGRLSSKSDDVESGVDNIIPTVAGNRVVSLADNGL